MNRCKLADWGLHPIGGGDREVLSWLKEWQEETSRIRERADGCPGFLPYKELAQEFWKKTTKALDT